MEISKEDSPERRGRCVLAVKIPPDDLATELELERAKKAITIQSLLLSLHHGLLAHVALQHIAYGSLASDANLISKALVAPVRMLLVESLGVAGDLRGVGLAVLVAHHLQKSSKKGTKEKEY